MVYNIYLYMYNLVKLKKKINFCFLVLIKILFFDIWRYLIISVLLEFIFGIYLDIKWKFLLEIVIIINIFSYFFYNGIFFYKKN